MIRIRQTIFFLCATILGPHLIQAQDAVKLTLKESLEIALKANNNIIKAQYDHEAGEQKTKEVKAQALPQLTASADVPHTCRGAGDLQDC